VLANSWPPRRNYSGVLCGNRPNAMPVIYRGADSVVKTTRGGEIIVRQKKEYKTWGALQNPYMILAPTFERFEFVHKSKKTGLVEMYMKRPSVSMLDESCDKCSGPHRPSRKECSAELHRLSPLANKSGFFNINSGAYLNPQPKIVAYNDSNRTGTVSTVLVQF
jgi:hypothetical protein